MQDLKEQKQRLRRKLGAVLTELDEGRLRASSGKICETVTSSSIWSECDIVLAYMAFSRGEVNVDALVRTARAEQRRIYVPRVEGKEMRFCVPGDCFNLSPFGIREPPPESPVLRLDEISDCSVMVIVPGVAFDRGKSRLGRGGGYYDRFLRRLESKSRVQYLLGVCFYEQLVPEVPWGSHDIPVNGVVTDRYTDFPQIFPPAP